VGVVVEPRHKAEPQHKAEPLHELFNFRDLSGLPTSCSRQIRPGQIFRTGNISHISQNTAQHLTEKLGVQQYIDFRTNEEIKAFGQPKSLLEQGVVWHNLHIDTDDKLFKQNRRPLPHEWAELYGRLFEKNLGHWVEFLHKILEAKGSLIYGCVFGKDRTGIATSFLLSSIDVHSDHIQTDYAKTTNNMLPQFYRPFMSFWDNSDLSEAELLQHYLTAHPEVMQKFLGTLNHKLTELQEALSRTGWTTQKQEQLKAKILV